MDLRNAIDHTVLNPEAGRTQIVRLCEETLEHRFASACLHPHWVKEMARRFPALKLCTVINFPLGLSLDPLHEAERAVLAGASELDIVVNPALVMEGEWEAIEEELASFRRIFAEITLKLIIESCQRTDAEIIQLTELCSGVGFDFIKTSTGFAREGASLHAVELMAKHAQGDLKVKASGGIKSLAQAEAMLKAGASRIGTSSGIEILREFEARA